MLRPTLQIASITMSLIERTIEIRFQQKVCFTRGVFESSNLLLKEVLCAGQAESGVCVKNGINAFGKKNFIGTFSVPFAVINDFEMLASLSSRDKRAGYIEAVKVACIRDADFFEVIETDGASLRSFEPAAM